MSNKLVDLIIKYNELTPKEKKLFSEVIGIEIKEVPIITPRSVEDIMKPKHVEPYKPMRPYEKYVPLPDTQPYRGIPIQDLPSIPSYPYYPLDIRLQGDSSS